MKVTLIHNTEGNRNMPGGITIMFDAEDTIRINDHVSVNVESKLYVFKVDTISLTEKTSNAVANMCGSRAVSRSADLDLRSFISAEVTVFTDEKYINRLHQNACLC